MKICEWKYICLILMFVAALSGFTQKEIMAAEDHVPEGIIMQTEFRPGFGDPLGLFKKTIGRVVLVHTAETLGYWAESDLPLYMKDRVVTPLEGLALLQFLDESTISVAEDSELVINRFIFDPDKLDRSTFLNMKSGKSRFWVKKLQDYTRSDFKVKTKTLIAGVRGSDFVIEVRQDSTEVFALEDTVLEIISLAAPGKVVVLRSFEKVRVDEGREVSPIEKITPAEASRLRQELPMPFDRDVMDAAGIFKTEGKGKAEAEEEDKKQPAAAEVAIAGQAAPAPAEQEEAAQRLQPAEEVYQAEEAAAEVVVKEEVVPTEEGEEKTLVPDEVAPLLDLGRETVILISEEDLATPVPVDEAGTAGQPPATDWFSRSLTLDPGVYPDIADIPLADAGGQVQGEDILQSLIETNIIGILPGPPGTP